MIPVKKLFLIYFNFHLTIFVFAQAKEFPKLKSSTVGIQGMNIMIDQGETSVADWFTYVYNHGYKENRDNRKADASVLQPFLPDSTLLPQKYRFMLKLFYRWSGDEANDKEYSEHFFFANNVSNTTIVTDDRGFYLLLSKQEVKDGIKSVLENSLSLPMVSVSYTQVKEYLSWREELANAEKNVTEKGHYLSARMLKKEEWEKLSHDIGPHFAENNSANIDTVNKEGCYLLNIKVDKPCTSVLEGRKKYGEGSVGVFSYNPDRLGLYSMYGNVSEMTDKDGIAMGGSYKDYGNICAPDKIISYSGPQQWLGFRCVFEITK
jgi:formylglycine-generating enzyme required for sulfatase activity